MQINKSQIIDMLPSQGKTDEASRADSELPDQVDTEKDTGLQGQTPRSLDRFQTVPAHRPDS
jgi:hypothetical protein